MPSPLVRTEVQVSTLAKPISSTLLAARTAIRVSPELQALFLDAREANLSAEQLANVLLVTLPDYLVDPADLWETCRYLADEFVQLGEHTLLISSATGQAIACITPEDIYVPAQVSRETGDLAQPLPRLRPELEGAIVQWQFDRAQDQKTLQTLARRLPSSELLAVEGDNRLLQATYEGRLRIVDQVRQALPTLLQKVPGTAGEFIRLCCICEPHEVPARATATVPNTAFSRVVRPVVDPLAINLHHDPYTTLCGKIGVEWVRDITRTITGLVHAHRPVEQASVLDTLPGGLWIVEPNTAMALRGRRVLPVPGATATLIYDWNTTPVVYITLREDSFACRSREFLGRWEVAAAMEFTLHIDLPAFGAYRFTDVPQSGVSVEVV